MKGMPCIINFVAPRNLMRLKPASQESSRRSPRSARATRRADNLPAAQRASAHKIRYTSLAFTCLTAFSLSPNASIGNASMGADPQAQESLRPLAPPVNHEAGRIDEVITAADAGYRFRGYVLTWRSMRIVVAGDPDQSYANGDNLDFVVYRSEVEGRRVLRFLTNTPDSSENIVDHESTGSSASVTMGTARIEDVVSADSDGYRFEGYFVNWHEKRVFVVDPLSAPARAIGETLNFRVLRTGLGATQRLSFSL